ncbi:MAG: GTP-binding protein [Candidatus Kapaibacterium sp.]
MIFQSVGNYGIMTEGPHWQPGEERQTKLVFIGRKLNKELINSILDELRI